MCATERWLVVVWLDVVSSEDCLYTVVMWARPRLLLPRHGPGEARTILLLHIISVRPSKQPLMVRTFLKVYMDLVSYFLFLQEQIKDIIINPTLSLTGISTVV